MFEKRFWESRLHVFGQDLRITIVAVIIDYLL